MDYSRLIDLTKRKIVEYGMKVTFLHRDVGEYDPIKGEIHGVINEVDVMAVLVSPGEKVLASATIHVGDAVLLIDGTTLPMVPDEKFVVRIQDEEWQVVNVSLVAPAGYPIMFKVYIRKA